MRTPVMVADASTNSESEMEQQQIMPQAQRILSDSAERDAAVRLTEAKQLKITKPVVDFYNLCSYNETFVVVSKFKNLYNSHAPAKYTCFFSFRMSTIVSNPE